MTTSTPHHASSPLLIDQHRKPDETFPIWPSEPPGPSPQKLNEHVSEREHPLGMRNRAAFEITSPSLSLFKAPQPDGSAMMIIPGGGYRLVVVDNEGYDGARYFSSYHTNTYVLRYRLPHQGWAAGPDTPLQDAQRALRMIRARSTRDGIDPQRILVMGFSAGGHLTGSLCQRYDADIYSAVDTVDEHSARPNLGAMIYPVTLMNGPHVHQGSRLRLLGNEPRPEQLHTYDVTHQPNSNGPPMFMVHALDDSAVPVENTLAFATKAREVHLPTSLHIFAEGGHGFGFRGIDHLPVAAWPKLLRDWAEAHTFYRKDLLTTAKTP